MTWDYFLFKFPMVISISSCAYRQDYTVSTFLLPNTNCNLPRCNFLNSSNAITKLSVPTQCWNWIIVWCCRHRTNLIKTHTVNYRRDLTCPPCYLWMDVTAFSQLELMKIHHGQQLSLVNFCRSCPVCTIITFACPRFFVSSSASFKCYECINSQMI